MGRILCIDYGGRRTGLAVTDPLKIIATALATIESKELLPFLKNYCNKESVELILMGEPKNWDESDTHATPLVKEMVGRIKKELPNMPLQMIDERYTSVMAKQSMLAMGMKKKERRIKGNVDQIAATIMLQEYLQKNSNNV